MVAMEYLGLIAFGFAVVVALWARWSRPKALEFVRPLVGGEEQRNTMTPREIMQMVITAVVLGGGAVGDPIQTFCRRSGEVGVRSRRERSLDSG